MAEAVQEIKDCKNQIKVRDRYGNTENANYISLLMNKYVHLMHLYLIIKYLCNHLTKMKRMPFKKKK